MLRYVIIIAVIVGVLFFLNQVAQRVVFSQPIYQIGEFVDDFTTTDADGKTVRFSDHQGKVILLTFFANWCAPCHEEAPQLEKDFHQKYKNRGLQIIGICDDEKEGAQGARTFRKTHSLTYPLWVKPTGEASKKMKPKNIPWNVLINRWGVVVESSVGFEPYELETKIEKLLRQKP